MYNGLGIISVIELKVMLFSPSVWTLWRSCDWFWFFFCFFCFFVLSMIIMNEDILLSIFIIPFPCISPLRQFYEWTNVTVITPLSWTYLVCLQCVCCASLMPNHTVGCCWWHKLCLHILHQVSVLRFFSFRIIWKLADCEIK